MERLHPEVDYSDKTPNELRFVKDGTPDACIFYPRGNIYKKTPAKADSPDKTVHLPHLFRGQSIPDKKWFLERLYADQIEYAVRYLQTEALRFHIKRDQKNMFVTNPFFHLLYAHYPIELNKTAALDVIQVLIENCSDHVNMINELRCLRERRDVRSGRLVFRGQRPRLPKPSAWVELMNSALTDDINNLCSICLSTHPIDNLITACDCKTKAHADCLVELHKHTPLELCAVCTLWVPASLRPESAYKINEPVVKWGSPLGVFFPHSDMYYRLLTDDNVLFRCTGMERLDMAIMYLQVDRVDDLLHDECILRDLPTHYLGHSGYKQTPLIAVATGNLPSNCNQKLGTNKSKYLKILKLLLNASTIDVHKKDTFGKTMFDYLFESFK
jgi:hypothetical protein